MTPTHSNEAAVYGDPKVISEVISYFTDLLKEADDVLADLGQTHDDVVGVDVAEGGVVSALAPRLVQQQVPAVHRGQQVLVLPAPRRGNTGLLQPNQTKRCCEDTSFRSHLKQLHCSGLKMQY